MSRDLSSAQRNQLAQRIKRAHGRQKLAPTIPRHPDSGASPLSMTQERFWFLEQLTPGTTDYNRPITLCIRGQLDTVILQKTLNEIVRRHAMLRVTFVDGPEGPQQICHSPFELALNTTDLSQSEVSDKEEIIRRWFDQAIAHPFDLSQGPLLRAALLRLASDEHLFLLVAHHILFDAWSARLFIREMVRLKKC